MRIEITYPHDFPLTGWDKAMFGVRVAGMFKQRWLAANTLDSCRKSAGLGEGPKQLRDDIHELHCVNFSGLPKDVLDELPAKVGEYIGVGLRRIYRPPALTWPLVVIALAVLLAVGVSVASFVSRTSAHEKTVASMSSLPAIPKAPLLMPSALPLEPARSLEPLSPDPIFSASITTANPRQSVERIAAAIPASAGTFDVSVSVTQSPDVQ